MLASDQKLAIFMEVISSWEAKSCLAAHEIAAFYAGQQLIIMFTREAVVGSRQNVVLMVGGWACGCLNPRRKTSAGYEMLHRAFSADSVVK